MLIQVLRFFAICGGRKWKCLEFVGGIRNKRSRSM